MRLLAPLLAFVLAWLLLRALLLPAARRWFLDHPNPRSLHSLPTPRTGGLGIVPGLAAGMALAGAGYPAMALAVGLMVLSLLDDWKSLPAGVRLAGHLAAAGTFVLVAADVSSWTQAALWALAIGWMTNLYNFMDGADGLAGGMAVFGFCAYSAAAWMAGDAALALASGSVAAAAVAFLLVNFPPARMFMGDAGSVPLGFLAAALGLQGWSAGLWPLWFPVVAFAPFVADATITLLRRVLRGEKVWRAHRSHYYQRLVLMGWSHRQLAVFEYGLMLATGLIAVIALHLAAPLQAVVIAMLALAYVAVGVAVDLRWRSRQEA